MIDHEKALASGMLRMRAMSTLVVFYSRTGTTRKVAETLANDLGSDIEELREATDRRGIRGYVRSLLDATFSRWVPIDAPGCDPTRYDLVVVGTPVWGASISAPVRSFLASHAGRLPKVAFFVTEGGRGERRVFQQMAEVAAVHPVATLSLLQSDVDHGTASGALESFVAALRKKTTVASRFAERLS